MEPEQERIQITACLYYSLHCAWVFMFVDLTWNTANQSNTVNTSIKNYAFVITAGLLLLANFCAQMKYFYLGYKHMQTMRERDNLPDNLPENDPEEKHSEMIRACAMPPLLSLGTTPTAVAAIVTGARTTGMEDSATLNLIFASNLLSSAASLFSSYTLKKAQAAAAARPLAP